MKTETPTDAKSNCTIQSLLAGIEVGLSPVPKEWRTPEFVTNVLRRSVTADAVADALCSLESDSLPDVLATVCAWIETLEALALLPRPDRSQSPRQKILHGLRLIEVYRPHCKQFRLQDILRIARRRVRENFDALAREGASPRSVIKVLRRLGRGCSPQENRLLRRCCSIAREITPPNPAQTGASDYYLTWDKGNGYGCWGCEIFKGPPQQALLLWLLARGVFEPNGPRVYWQAAARKLWPAGWGEESEAAQAKDKKTLETAFSRLRTATGKCWGWTKAQLPDRDNEGFYLLNILRSRIHKPPAHMAEAGALNAPRAYRKLTSSRKRKLSFSNDIAERAEHPEA